jgi:flagellar hook-basal body complex protein FliE
MTTPIRPNVGPVVSPFERAGELLGRPAEGPSFGEVLQRGLNDVQQLQDDSKDMIAAFLRGEPVELHQVMAAGEEAGIALELLVEIKNKLTEAYRQVMSIQV